MSHFILKDQESKSPLQSWLRRAMAYYAKGAGLKWGDEDTLCEHFFASLGGGVTTPNGTFYLRSYKVRGRALRAPEKSLGADGIGIVTIRTENTELSGYFLFQTKKSVDSTSTLRGAKTECGSMLRHSAASYLLVLTDSDAKMVGAIAVDGCRIRDPSLTQVPFVGFPIFVAQHIFQGVMLEPLATMHTRLTPDLREELKHVLLVTGGRGREVEEAQMSVDVSFPYR